MNYLYLVANLLAFTAWLVDTIQYLDDSHIGKPCNTVLEQWFDRIHPCKIGYYCKNVNCSVKKIVRYRCYNSSFYPSDKKLRCEREPACPWKPQQAAPTAHRETWLDTPTTTITSVTPTPFETTVIPEETAITPDDTTITPDEATISNNEATITPNEAITTRVETTIATYEMTTTTDEMTKTTYEMTTNPAETTTTTDETTTTQPETTNTPPATTTTTEYTTEKPKDTSIKPTEQTTLEHKKCEKLMEGIVGRYLFRHDSNCQTYWECKWKPFIHHWSIVEYSCKAETIFNEQQQDCVSGSC